MPQGMQLSIVVEQPYHQIGLAAPFSLLTGKTHHHQNVHNPTSGQVGSKHISLKRIKEDHVGISDMLMTIISGS